MSKLVDLEKKIEEIDNKLETWHCINCCQATKASFKKYEEIKKEYGKYLCPSCREKRDEENNKIRMKEFEELSNLRRSNIKITSEPKAEYTLDLHWLSQRNEDLLKEVGSLEQKVKDLEKELEVFKRISHQLLLELKNAK